MEARTICLIVKHIRIVSFKNYLFCFDVLQTYQINHLGSYDRHLYLLVLNISKVGNFPFNSISIIVQMYKSLHRSVESTRPKRGY